MGTTDPQVRIFSGPIIRALTGTSAPAWKAAEGIGLIRPSNHGRELYCLEDAYRLSLFGDLRGFGLQADKIQLMVDGFFKIDWTKEGVVDGLCDTPTIRLLVCLSPIVGAINASLACLSVTLAAAPPEQPKT